MTKEPRGGFKESTPILQRIEHRLFPNDIRHIKLGVVDYLVETDIDPTNLTCSIRLLQELLPYIQIQNDSWVGMNKSDINTTTVAMKNFYDIVNY